MSFVYLESEPAIVPDVAVLEGFVDLESEGHVLTINGQRSAFMEVTGLGLTGPPGSTSDFVFGETPSGLVNGSNATFVTAFPFIAESLIPSVNGLEQKLGLDFIITGVNTFVFNESPTTGEIISVTYIKA